MRVLVLGREGLVHEAVELLLAELQLAQTRRRRRRRIRLLHFARLLGRRILRENLALQRNEFEHSNTEQVGALEINWDDGWNDCSRVELELGF